MPAGRKRAEEPPAKGATAEEAPARRARSKRAARGYHHGDLKRVLVEAGLALLEEGGVEAVRVREAARRAGVSPAAPFRHFPSREEFLRAVALAGIERFQLASAAEVAAAPSPLLRFRALGLASVRFALEHPALFELLNGPAFRGDPEGARALLAAADEARSRLQKMLEEARAGGELRPTDPVVTEVAGRALAYGLARMFLDGHLPREGAMELTAAVLDVLGEGLATRRPDPG
ncbi:TetR family transcriptional regulator [Sorangium cellulosum]|uniref:TetR family transcriptional regulator n=1 Tax=Sorangium cellulosum TaxID=56 RepID=A0A2L0EK91_SORCE|nr:TetR/AcrR family transcriptional regulator [Sorangium cellulosum]AUX39702.1 TetR family transcriptional regulator [Sorangium cellulosum]